jgi:hypothetical protein
MEACDKPLLIFSVQTIVQLYRGLVLLSQIQAFRTIQSLEPPIFVKELLLVAAVARPHLKLLTVGTIVLRNVQAQFSSRSGSMYDMRISENPRLCGIGTRNVAVPHLNRCATPLLSLCQLQAL